MLPELIAASVVDVGVPNDQLEDVDQSELLVEVQLSIIEVEACGAIPEDNNELNWLEVNSPSLAPKGPAPGDIFCQLEQYQK